VQTYDIIMLAVLLGMTMFGAWKGLAWQIAATSSLVVSYIVAFKFRDSVAEMLPLDKPLSVFVAMLILYLGTSLAVWMIFRYVSEMINKIKLKDFDRQAGALLGLATGVCFCLVITFFAMSLSTHAQRRQICDSRSGFYITRVIDKVHTIMPDEIHEVLGPYLHSLDRKLRDEHEDEQSENGERSPLRFVRDNHASASKEETPGQGGDSEPDGGFKIRFGDTDYGIRFPFGKESE